MKVKQVNFLSLEEAKQKHLIRHIAVFLCQYVCAALALVFCVQECVLLVCVWTDVWFIVYNVSVYTVSHTRPSFVYSLLLLFSLFSWRGRSRHVWTLWGVYIVSSVSPFTVYSPHDPRLVWESPPSGTVLNRYACQSLPHLSITHHSAWQSYFNIIYTGTLATA